MKPLGVAVIGLGIGEQHARGFATLPACKLQLLHDLDTSRAEALSVSFPGCRVAHSLDEILASPEVDIVSIASFDAAHFEQVMAALNAGKHVFVEKPLCRSEAELRAISNQLQAADGRLHLDSNLVLRAAPLYRWLREEITAGRFGTIYAIDGEYLYGRLHKITGGWRKEEQDYSVMLGGGIHMIDLILWLTGQRPTTVVAQGNAISTQGTSFHYNDFVAATLGFESGMIGRAVANFGCVHRHQHVLRIYGTEQTFLLDDAGPRLHSSRDPDMPPTRLELDMLPPGKAALLPTFVQAILDPGSRDIAARQAIFDGISVALACDRAVQTSTLQPVTYV
jgi:predicted dehydrogenase